MIPFYITGNIKPMPTNGFLKIVSDTEPLIQEKPVDIGAIQHANLIALGQSQGINHHLGLLVKRDGVRGAGYVGENVSGKGVGIVSHGSTQDRNFGSDVGRSQQSEGCR